MEYTFPVTLLQTITQDVRIYTDPDACIDTITSVKNKTILLVLGPGRSSLISILSTFNNLRFIYQSEPYHFTGTTRVRKNSDTHLHLKFSGDATHDGALTKDFQRNNHAFVYSICLGRLTTCMTTSSRNVVSCTQRMVAGK